MDYGAAVVDKGRADGARDKPMLAISPHAHEQLNVVNGPGAPLKMTVGAVQWRRIRPTEADVPLVMVIEVSSDGNQVRGAPSVESQVEAYVSDQIVEALLPIERSTCHRERSVSGVFDAEGSGAADIVDGRTRHAA